MSDVIYNNQTYKIEILFARLDQDEWILKAEGQTASVNESPVDLSTAENTTRGVAEYASNIMLFNDYTNPYPFLEFEYKDMGTQTIVRYPADGHTTILFTVSLVKPDGKLDTVSHMFEVVDIKPMVNLKDYTVFKVKAVSILYNTLSSLVEYSTGGDNKKYPTQIAREILLKVKYPVMEKQYRSSLFESAVGADPAVASDTAVVESSDDTKMVYISPANYTVMANVDYLLKMASRSEKSGLFYLLFNINDQMGYIANPNSQMGKIDLSNMYSYVLPFNIATIPGRVGDSGSELLNITDMYFENYIGGHNMFNYTGNTKIYNFDYIRRALVPDNYPFDRVVDVIPSLSESSKTFQSVYKKKSDLFKDNKYDREETNWAYSKLFWKTDSLFRLSNTLQFTMQGHVFRDIGQLMIVRSNSPILNFRYGGVYEVARVRHCFANKKYVNDITAVRTMELKLKGE